MYAQLLLCLLLLRSVTLTDVTYYEILGVSKQASTQEIRQAYKKLAIKFHPDKNPNSSQQEKFLKVTEAYETLKDPDKRHKYDVYGSYPSYTRRYDYHSQSEYNSLYYNGLYHGDAFVDTLSGGSFYSYLQEGFHFINFYSPFCPPCQDLADHWKNLAEIYKGIIKVGALNCKYYNSFCYNTMRIASYPTLLFYPNGKNGNFIYYRGDRTLEALEQFVMKYLQSQVHLPTLTQIRDVVPPMAYVLGRNRIEENALLRIAYHLKGLVTFAVVEEDSFRAKLTKNDYTTVVFKYKGTTKEIESTDEKEVLKEIVDTMPRIEMIEPEKLKKIRNKLRSGDETPWVLLFSSKGQDRLLLHQMKITFSDMHFGEVKCDKWAELCSSLQVDSPPAWGVLKPGGAYQLLPPSADVRAYIRTAASAVRLHSLSASDLAKITDGDVGTWVLLVVPFQLSWDHLVDPFTKASLHYVESDDVSFGIMVCNLNTDKYCRQLAPNEPAILVQDGAKRHAYRDHVRAEQIIEFIELIKDNAELELTESEVIEVMGNSNRQHTWVIAFFPAQCGRLCDQLLLEWRKVAAKLRPLQAVQGVQGVRAGALQCARHSSGLCANVRAPVARLYPRRSRQHYSVNLQQLSQAPYMLEWALQYIDTAIQTLDWHSFSRLVAAEELNPTGGKRPWLVYFHSPRCYRCYEMYADFAVAGMLLNNAVNLGKVNCLNERGLCQNEQVNSYPSLKLYLSRNHQQRFSSIISVPVKEYASLLEEIRPHLMKYDANLLAGIDEMGVRSEFHIRHDEF